MKKRFWDSDLLPTLLFDPDNAAAAQLAARLNQRGLNVEVAQSAAAMLTTVREKYFRSVVVVVDLDDTNCRTFIADLRTAARRSWLFVASARHDDDAEAIIHRHNVDVWIAAPILKRDLLRRLLLLQVRARPEF